MSEHSMKALLQQSAARAMEYLDDLETPMPMNLITGHELEVYGSHGMQAWKYSEIFECIESGLLSPGDLVTDVVDLEEGVEILMHMNEKPPLGIAVIEM